MANLTGYFYSATIAQEYAKFWVGVESTPVRVVQRGSIIAPVSGISTTRRPILPTNAVYVPETELTVIGIYRFFGSPVGVNNNP